VAVEFGRALAPSVAFGVALPQPLPTRLCLSAGLAAALAAASGCASIGDFDVERTIAEQRVQGNPLAGLLKNLFAVPIPMDVDIKSETAARDTGPARAAHLSELALQITDSSTAAGDTDDFGFLDSVDVFVESTRQGTSLPRVLIARAAHIEAAERLDFDVVRTVDVLPYADEGSRFTSDVQGSVPPDDVSFDGHFTLRVELF
jgi:hypothetical protein